MKVVAAKIYVVTIGGRHPVLVQVVTDTGLSGVGEAAVAYGTGAWAAAGMVKELADTFLLGKDPSRIEALWAEMYDHTFWAKGGGPIIFAGISAIEQALWDIKGKALGVPVYELLGGRCRDTARVYANGWSFRCVTPGCHLFSSRSCTVWRAPSSWECISWSGCLSAGARSGLRA